MEYNIPSRLKILEIRKQYVCHREEASVDIFIILLMLSFPLQIPSSLTRPLEYLKVTYIKIMLK